MNKLQYICADCSSALVGSELEYQCVNCGRTIDIKNGIPDFRERDEYWCNVDRNKMNLLNKKARDTGDWLKAAKEVVPQYHIHFSDFRRADYQFIWPIDKEAIVLDAGSMWGGLTIPVAQYCKEVYAVDKTIETLEFLGLRASQMGLKNIKTVAASLKKLPFPDNSFDLIILNGVLEWVAFEQEIILEKHFGKRRNDVKKTYKKDPRTMQLNVLKELQRILKPGGALHLAIENRIGYPYFLGEVDNHSKLKFTTILPRFVANFISMIKLNSEYRTYTYSKWGYQALLRESGFNHINFYGVFPHYHIPRLVAPFDTMKNLINMMFSRLSRITAIFPMIADCIKYFSPSIIATAHKKGQIKELQPRLLCLLRDADLLRNFNIADLKVVFVGGRPANYNRMNYLIFDKSKNKPIFFCKICRSKQDIEIVEAEAKGLKEANRLLSKSNIKRNIPKLIYYGLIKEVPILVTDFINGKSFPTQPRQESVGSYLKKLDKHVYLAIDLLAEFQKETKTREISAREYLTELINKQRGGLAAKNCLTTEVDHCISDLLREICLFGNSRLFLCAVHGDYTFFNNLLFNNKTVNVIDFEHFEGEGLPFFDLATLIVVSLLMVYRSDKRGISFSDFIEENNLKKYISDWLNYYSKKSGINIRLLKMFHKFAVLEQNTKNYPYFRSTSSFPMYGKEALEELLSFDL